MMHRFVLAVALTCVAVAVTLGQDDTTNTTTPTTPGPTPCLQAPVISPGFDALRLKEFVSYHDTTISKTLYVTDAAKNEYVLVDYVEGKVYERYADGTCSWIQIGDGSFDLLAAISDFNHTVTITGSGSPVLGFEFGQGDTRFGVLQRPEGCSGVLFTMTKADKPRLVYMYHQETPATPEELKPITDAASFFKCASCKQEA